MIDIKNHSKHRGVAMLNMATGVLVLDLDAEFVKLDESLIHNDFNIVIIKLVRG